MECGHSVKVLDLFQHRSFTLATCTGYQNFEVVKGDCRDVETIRECIKDVDWVIPLAALVGAPACNVDKNAAMQTNYMAIHSLTKELSPNQRILLPNSNSGYGTTKPGESATEESPLNPLSVYARSKAMGEEVALQRENTVAFRLATVFGPSPRMRMDLLVNDFTHRAMRDQSLVLYEPNFRRNYMHVYDVARLFLFGIQKFDTLVKQKVFNAGIANSSTKEQLCQQIQECLPSFAYFTSSTRFDADKRDYDVSVERLSQAGFTCHYSIKDGIKHLIKLYAMLPPYEFCNA